MQNWFYNWLEQLYNFFSPSRLDFFLSSHLNVFHELKHYIQSLTRRFGGFRFVALAGLLRRSEVNSMTVLTGRPQRTPWCLAFSSTRASMIVCLPTSGWSCVSSAVSVSKLPMVPKCWGNKVSLTVGVTQTNFLVLILEPLGCLVISWSTEILQTKVQDKKIEINTKRKNTYRIDAGWCEPKPSRRVKRLRQGSNRFSLNLISSSCNIADNMARRSTQKVLISFSDSY